MKEKVNKTMMQYFEWYIKHEEKLWNKIEREAAHLSSIGIDSVWLPPAYKGAKGVDDTGYAVYDLYDLGEFDQKGAVETKYGTKEEYINAIKVLKGNGIKVYADIVLNHRIGADEKEEVVAVKSADNNRQEEISEPKTIKAETVFNFEGRNNMYSDFKWRWMHFHGIDYDFATNEKGIYKFYGKHWDDAVDKERGNYDYLMGADVDFNNVDVVEELKKWGKWFVNETGVNGFRLDAVKHIRSTFFNDWINFVSSDFEEKLLVIGEYWSNDLESLIGFVKQTDADIKLFDVPLHYNFYNASNSGENYDMRTILSNTLMKSMPNCAIPFVDNHDTEPGQSLYSWISDWFKPLAYALILLQTKSEPCVFYGDYYGIEHENILPKDKMIDNLLRIRRHFVYGRQNAYFDDKNVIGWTYEGDYDHPDSGVAVIMTNGLQEGVKAMNVGNGTISSLMYDCTGNVDEEVMIDENGNGTFKCKPKSVSVWIKKGNMYDE